MAAGGQWTLGWHGMLRHVRAAVPGKGVVAMDPQTVIAVCEVLLVVIGIIGLVLIRR